MSKKQINYRKLTASYASRGIGASFAPKHDIRMKFCPECETKHYMFREGADRWRCGGTIFTSKKLRIELDKWLRDKENYKYDGR